MSYQPARGRRPARYLSCVQAAIHEALQQCHKNNAQPNYQELKQLACASWESRFSSRLAQWGINHSLPLTEECHQRRLPPNIRHTVRQSMEALDSDNWCQTLLLTHDPKVLFVTQTASCFVQTNPYATFYELAAAVTSAIDSDGGGYPLCDNSEEYLHFQEYEEEEQQEEEPQQDGWQKVKRRRPKRKVRMHELKFADAAWFYAFKIFCFPYYNTRGMHNFVEAREWVQLSPSPQHHNRIIDHARTIVQNQLERETVRQQSPHTAYQAAQWPTESDNWADWTEDEE